jgi:hypothetical protein
MEGKAKRGRLLEFARKGTENAKIREFTRKDAENAKGKNIKNIFVFVLPGVFA